MLIASSNEILLRLLRLKDVLPSERRWCRIVLRLHLHAPHCILLRRIASQGRPAERRSNCILLRHLAACCGALRRIASQGRPAERRPEPLLPAARPRIRIRVAVSTAAARCCGLLRLMLQLIAAHADSRPPGPSRPSRVRVVASEQPHPLTVSGSPHPRHRLRVTASESRPRHHIGAAASSHHIRATASESRHARHRIRVAASESPPPSRRGSGCRRVRVGQASPRPRRRVGRRAR